VSRAADAAAVESMGITVTSTALTVVANANRLRGSRPRADPDDARTPATDAVVGVGRDENKEDNMVENSQKRADPVCGMGVDPATAAANVEHDGTTYYFCSTRCATTFKADPHKYASATTS